MIAERIPIRTVPRGGAEISRGLVCMLLATVIFYVTSAQTILPIPFAIPPAVTTYLLPLLFLLGLGFAIFGVARRTGLV